MRVAFYAPLKPPMHPVPSGDRRVARLLMDALAEGGHAVELVSRFRSWDGAGDGARQARLREVGARLAKRLARRLLNRPAHLQPELWFTYHLYHKAPDWLGPPVSAELGIPYVVAEASVADKQADGPWAEGHAASIEALRRADAVFELNPADEPGVRPHLPGPGRLHPLPPFLDIAPYAEARRARLCYRDSFADELDLPKDEPWLLAVAMMRPGDKLASYRALAAALGRVAERSWRLLLVGDGPARQEVEMAFAWLGERVRFLGARPAPVLAPIYAAADLLVWPAVNEAFGMAILEAQAAGLPSVAGDWGGVAQLVAHGKTGLVVPRGDESAFAEAVRALLVGPSRRAAMGEAAALRAEREHGLSAAAQRIDAVLSGIGRR